MTRKNIYDIQDEYEKKSEISQTTLIDHTITKNNNKNYQEFLTSFNFYSCADDLTYINQLEQEILNLDSKDASEDILATQKLTFLHMAQTIEIQDLQERLKQANDMRNQLRGKMKPM